MLVPIIVGSIAVILTFLSQSRQNGWGLKAAFVIIFAFLALRYDYGNDYMGYLELFEDIAYARDVDVNEMWWEPGWILLNLVFKPFGFFAMVTFTSLVTCVVIYRFMRNYVPAQYQWLGMFIYVFDPGLFLLPASAMRQNIAILLFLVGFEFLYKKRLLVYFVLMAVAWSFHQSAKLLVPIALLAFANIRISRFIAVLCVVMYASLYLYGEQVFNFIFNVAGNMFEEYTEYQGGTSLRSGLGLVYSLFLLGGILYFAGVEFSRSERAECEEIMPERPESFPNLPARRLLFKLAILTFMFTPLALQLAMVSRINMYFAPVMVAVYPIIAVTTRNGLYRLMLLGSLIAYKLYAYVTFFNTPVWEEKFGTYKTIMSLYNWW